MAQQSMDDTPPLRKLLGRFGWWLLVVGSAVLLIFVLGSEVVRFSTPIQLHRLQIVKEFPLPDALPDPNRTSQNPFAAGKAERFDHFDFQAFDPRTHLLFIVHSGPNPDKQAAIQRPLQFDASTDGNLVIFDVQQNKVVGMTPVPQGAGVIVASDLNKVFVGDAGDSIIYVVDEHSPFKVIDQIQLDPNDGPDAIEYDPVNHTIFVADPGIPPNPDDANTDLKNQNVAVIDANTDKLITKIPFGLDKPFGDDVGHIQYDPVTNQIYVVTLKLQDQNLNSPALPPTLIAVIDPNSLQIVSRVRLPDGCLAGHGMVVDAQQREAFVACVDSQNMVRVDLKAMKPFAEDPLPVAFNPDIVRLDRTAHVLFIGCAAGISAFDISGGGLKPLGSYVMGGGSEHTVAIDESTQLLYLPQPSVGDRPVLRVIKYLPNGQ